MTFAARDRVGSALNVAAAGTTNFLLRGGVPAAKYGELTAWNSEISTLNRLAIRQNIASYYGITLS